MIAILLFILLGLNAWILYDLSTVNLNQVDAARAQAVLLEKLEELAIEIGDIRDHLRERDGDDD